MKRRIAAVLLAAGITFGVAMPSHAATKATATPASATGGCIWILSYQLCIPYL